MDKTKVTLLNLKDLDNIENDYVAGEADELLGVVERLREETYGKVKMRRDICRVFNLYERIDD